MPASLVGLITAEGQRCPDLSPALLAAQIKQESGFNPGAVSSVGALGLAQFMPGTWSGLKAAGKISGDPMNPTDAIHAQSVYDCQLANDVHHYGGDTQALLLAAYNCGTVNLARFNGQVPPQSFAGGQTTAYVRSILAMIQR